jgi:hypothetical protein
MIFGADLLASWPGFSANRQDAFRRFCRETALPLNTMDRNNNWGNWGLVLVLACARYLDDDELLDRGEQRWKELLDRQIDNQGHLHHEVHRSGGMRGIWYSHFSLFPQTIAAEILRLAGRDLYDWRSPGPAVPPTPIPPDVGPPQRSGADFHPRGVTRRRFEKVPKHRSMRPNRAKLDLRGVTRLPNPQSLPGTGLKDARGVDWRCCCWYGSWLFGGPIAPPSGGQNGDAAIRSPAG